MTCCISQSMMQQSTTTHSSRHYTHRWESSTASSWICQWLHWYHATCRTDFNMTTPRWKCSALTTLHLDDILINASTYGHHPTEMNYCPFWLLVARGNHGHLQQLTNQLPQTQTLQKHPSLFVFSSTQGALSALKCKIKNLQAHTPSVQTCLTGSSSRAQKKKNPHTACLHSPLMSLWSRFLSVTSESNTLHSNVWAIQFQQKQAPGLLNNQQSNSHLVLTEQQFLFHLGNQLGQTIALIQGKITHWVKLQTWSHGRLTDTSSCCHVVYCGQVL